MNQTTPAMNAGLSYMMGFDMAYLDGQNIAVKTGQCRDSENINDIYMPTTNLTLYTLKNGAWGIDTGSVLVDSVYYLYAIADSYKKSPTATIASLSAAQPLLPHQYDIWRRIGAFLTDGAGDIVSFYQCGGHNSTQRHMMFDDAIQILTNGQSATFASVSMAAFVPDIEFMAHLNVEIIPKNAGDRVHLKRGGSPSTDGVPQISGPVALVSSREYVYMPTYQNKIEYFIIDPLGSVNIWLSGYLDSL